MNRLPDIWLLLKVFTGRRPFSEFTTLAITSRIIDGERPARPQEAQEIGLKDSIWNMTVRCWHKDPAQRPTMTEVIGLLRESLVSLLSIEAGLDDLFRARGTWDEENLGKMAQEFSDRLDEVRHAEKHNIRSPQHTSRFLTMQIFPNQNASDI